MDDGVRRRRKERWCCYYYYYEKPATWRKCNATVTDDGDDDEVDNGVDGDDEGVEYYIFDGREKERLGGPNSNKPTNYGEK